MKRVVIALAGLLVLAAVGVGGYLLGATSEKPSVATRAELEQGLAAALGMTAAEVRDLDGFSEVTDCARISCQLMVYPVPDALGGDIQGRLYDAGWVLHSHDQPECVSDGPAIRGYVCSYQKGSVTVSVTPELPTANPDQLAVWVSTG